MAHLKLNREKLLDTLCERWFSAKKGTELYDLVIDKLDRHGHRDESQQLRRYREEKAEHCRAIAAFITRIGGDTNRSTPSQMPVLLESRALETIAREASGPAQLLHVIFAAELEDYARSELLLQLASEVGARDLVEAFDHAVSQDREHLRGIKALVTDQARRELVEEPERSEPLIPFI